MICPTHNKELKTGKYGLYCPTKVGDGWCSYKPPRQEFAAPAPTPSGTISVTHDETNLRLAALSFALKLYQGSGFATLEDGTTGEDAAMSAAERALKWLRGQS